MKNKNLLTCVMIATLSVLLLGMRVPTGIATSSPYVLTAIDTTNDMELQANYSAALMIGGDENDLGFSFMAIEGMNALEANFGWDIDITKNVASTDQYSVMSQYGDEGYDVVFMVGGQFIETSYFAGVAESYNDTLFVQIPGLNEYVYAPGNVIGLHPSFQIRGHYLAGVLAGSMTKTDKLGAVFGEWYEYLSLEYYAFKAGVESVNSNATVYCRVAGTWGDAAIGKQIAKALIDTKDVDIIVQVADATGRGVITACVEADIAVIGTVADQYELAPNNTMTSIGMNISMMMDIIAQKVENGTAKDDLGGTSYELHIGDYLYPYHNYDAIIPQEVKDLVADTKIAIENGSIVVPRISEEYAPDDPEGEDTPGFLFMQLAIGMIAITVVLRLRRKK
jgi:basic membrane protein A